MDDRIAPMFEESEQLRTENELLLKRFDEAKAKAERQRGRVLEAKKSAEAALEDFIRLEERAKGYKLTIKSKDEEILELKAALELKDKQVCAILIFHRER